MFLEANTAHSHIPLHVQIRTKCLFGPYLGWGEGEWVEVVLGPVGCGSWPKLLFYKWSKCKSGTVPRSEM